MQQRAVRAVGSVLPAIVRIRFAQPRRFAGWGLIAAFVITFAKVTAAAEFSAETIERGPQGVMAKGMMYVSGDRVRSEMTRHGVETVVISDRSAGKQWVLYPADHVVVELPSGAPQATAREPCADTDGARCIRLGDEIIAGRPVTKWEISQRDDGEAVPAFHWLDHERGIALRQVFPGGRRIEWRRVGLAVTEARHVEKWEVTAERPGRPPVRAFHWLDPELQVCVREEIPGGFVRKLRHIRVGVQPDLLFEVPPEFRRVTPVHPAETRRH